MKSQNPRRMTTIGPRMVWKEGRMRVGQRSPCVASTERLGYLTDAIHPAKQCPGLKRSRSSALGCAAWPVETARRIRRRRRRGHSSARARAPRGGTVVARERPASDRLTPPFPVRSQRLPANRRPELVTPEFGQGRYEIVKTELAPSAAPEGACRDHRFCFDRASASSSIFTNASRS